MRKYLGFTRAKAKTQNMPDAVNVNPNKKFYTSNRFVR